jgi:hypothetical protein
MIRYLKVIMKSKEENELYCTLTHLKVFGRSMHLSLVESFKDVNTRPAKEPELHLNATAEVHDVKRSGKAASAAEGSDCPALAEGGASIFKALL